MNTGNFPVITGSHAMKTGLDKTSSGTFPAITATQATKTSTFHTITGSRAVKTGSHETPTGALPEITGADATITADPRVNSGVHNPLNSFPAVVGLNRLAFRRDHRAFAKLALETLFGVMAGKGSAGRFARTSSSAARPASGISGLSATEQ